MFLYADHRHTLGSDIYLYSMEVLSIVYVTTSRVHREALRILTGLYLVTTMKMQGTTTIIQVLMRDGQYFSTPSNQVPVLNTFISLGILYYAGEQSLSTSGS